VSELYQCVREFHVAERPAAADAPAEIVACAALRLLWSDLGEVRSLAVREDMHGRGLGKALVERVLEDARALGLPRVIALTRDLPFFERFGFAAAPRRIDAAQSVDRLRPLRAARLRRSRRRARPGAGRFGGRRGRRQDRVLPIPQGRTEPSALPVVSNPRCLRRAANRKPTRHDERLPPPSPCRS
jgi:N-acetylglutamate synthase-like GNAT family acetyltransferase